MSDQDNGALILNDLPAPLLVEGQRFPNIEEAAHHLRDYCNHFYTHFRCKESRPSRYIAVCGDQANSGCQWEVRLFTGKDREGNDRGGQWEITHCQPLHTCSGCQIPKWSSQNNKAWLARKVCVSASRRAKQLAYSVITPFLSHFAQLGCHLSAYQIYYVPSLPIRIKLRHKVPIR